MRSAPYCLAFLCVMRFVNARQEEENECILYSETIQPSPQLVQGSELRLTTIKKCAARPSFDDDKFPEARGRDAMRTAELHVRRVF
jgi:hypothetical protein